jgi:hypothetical protein
VIFQDFARYEIFAAANVGYGAIDDLDDRAGIRAAAEGANIADTLDALPRGLDTPLTRQSSERICVEHANAEHKQWRPLQRYLGRREHFDETYAAIAGLVSDRAAER